MNRGKNSINHGRRVLVKAEWIEGRCGIGIEQRCAQRIVVHDSAQALFAIVLAIAEPAFPLPCLKVITELTQVTSEASGTVKIVGCNLVSAQPRLQTSVMYPSSESGTGRRGADLGLGVVWVKSARRRVIGNCERIEWILNRHANAYGD